MIKINNPTRQPLACPAPRKPNTSMTCPRIFMKTNLHPGYDPCDPYVCQSVDPCDSISRNPKDLSQLQDGPTRLPHVNPYFPGTAPCTMGEVQRYKSTGGPRHPAHRGQTYVPLLPLYSFVSKAIRASQAISVRGMLNCA